MLRNTAQILSEKYGMTDEEIAYRIGVTTMAVRNWRTGKHSPIAIFQRHLEELLASRMTMDTGRTKKPKKDSAVA